MLPRKRDVEKWREVAERNNRRRHQEPPQGVECSWCKGRVPVRVVRGRSTVVCPHCGERFANPLGRKKGGK